MVYLWSIPDAYSDKYVAVYNHKRSPDYLLYREGQYIKGVLPPAFFKLNKVNIANVRKYNCLQNSGSAPLVDKKTIDILDNICEFDVQLCDAIIECKDGIIEDYKIINIVHDVIAIDHSSSKYSLIPFSTAIMKFKHLVLKSKCLNNHVIARNKECLSQILVDQKLFDAFKENKITGVDLITVEDYNNIYC